MVLRASSVSCSLFFFQFPNSKTIFRLFSFSHRNKRVCAYSSVGVVVVVVVECVCIIFIGFTSFILSFVFSIVYGRMNGTACNVLQGNRVY